MRILRRVTVPALLLGSALLLGATPAGAADLVWDIQAPHSVQAVTQPHVPVSLPAAARDLVWD